MMSNKYTVIHTDSGHYLTVWCAIYEVVRHSSFKLHKMLCNATWATKNSQLGIPGNPSSLKLPAAIPTIFEFFLWILIVQHYVKLICFQL